MEFPVSPHETLSLEESMNAALMACMAVLLLGCAEGDGTDGTGHSDSRRELKQVMRIEYLEIVTPDVAAVCASYSQLHGLIFGEPVAELGNARTADLEGGGKIGVRAPMAETEAPVVRPYLLVEDIAASVKAAEDTGAMIALPPMELPGHGTCAIYIRGGVEHGLWQRD